MVIFDQKDIERIGKDTIAHLQSGETEMCTTLLKTLQLAEQTGAIAATDAGQIPKVYQKVALEAKETLTCQRKALEDRQFKSAFALYEQCLLLSMQSQSRTTGPAQVQDVYFNPNEVTQKMVMTTQADSSQTGTDGSKVIRPFGGGHEVPVS